MLYLLIPLLSNYDCYDKHCSRQSARFYMKTLMVIKCIGIIAFKLPIMTIDISFSDIASKENLVIE